MSSALQDRYELVEQIGQGGMASVWRAKALGYAGFQRTCVIKRVLRGSGPEEDEKLAMFVREARLSALLSHRNIVQVFDFGVADGEYYLAMEYVEGRDLLDLCRAIAGAPPPVGAVVFIVREVCRALGYAHELADEEGRHLGLVHRDVSPSNVLVAADGSVKLLDFGIAKAISEGTGLTRMGNIRGKLSYMSPEQLSGGPIDARSDVFATGVLLHEMLCLRRLFRGDDDEATVQRLLEMEVPPPSRWHPDVSLALDAVCLRALARDVDSRFQSAVAMADALDPIVRELGWDTSRMTDWLKHLPPRAAIGGSSVPADLSPLPAPLPPPPELTCYEVSLELEPQPTRITPVRGTDLFPEETSKHTILPRSRVLFMLLLMVLLTSGAAAVTVFFRLR